MIREFHNADCMEVMKNYPDNYFDLAIVDPPYGNKGFDAVNKIDSKTNIAARSQQKVAWNDAPNDRYFLELQRVSKNWIVWGGNFFNISGGAIVWNKQGTAFGEGEIAITSLIKSVRFFNYRWNGMLQQNMKKKEKRIHPTQKPVALYRWLLDNYAKPGDLLLDTHVGSASSLIAFEEKGFEYVASELDEDYYRAASKRIAELRSQQRLFDLPVAPKKEYTQGTLI